MANMLFNMVSFRKPVRSKFDLSREWKGTIDMGKLIPVYVEDIVPGDKFRVSTEWMIRMQPMLAPIMHRINVTVHYFWVPLRLIWSESELFFTGGKDGTSNPVWPHILTSVGDNVLQSEGLLGRGTLWDNMGCPTLETSEDAPTQPLQVSSLPFRAMQLIYNNYYRDQNLENELAIPMTSGQESATNSQQLLVELKRAWEKDYFTSGLPWAQRGPDVMMPIDGVAEAGDITYSDTTVVEGPGGPIAGPVNLQANTGILQTTTPETVTALRNIEEVRVSNSETSIRDLRRASRLQEWYERMAVGGARYVELIRTMFGKKSSDARLQRPVFLGGGTQGMMISEVVSTYQNGSTGTGDELPQGNMAGHGLGVGRAASFRKEFEEHGYVIGIMSVLPRTAYQQGLPRHFSRDDKFKYAWPLLANIGEQEILNKELYWDKDGSGPDPLKNNGTFAYQSRYCEYKYGISTVHGDLKSSMSYWGMQRIFQAPPQLTTEFVMSDPTTRIFAAQDVGANRLIVQVYNKVDAVRPLPYYGTPTL